MSEDPTRAIPRPVDPELPPHGSVGPVDPHADPATDPSMRAVRPPAAEGPTVPTGPDGPAAPTGPSRPGEPERVEPVLTRTRMSGLWTGLILSAVVLVFLLIFILQNSVPVRINFLAASGTLPAGVALLFAAIAGVLLVGIPGGLRILQLRRAARRVRGGRR